LLSRREGGFCSRSVNRPTRSAGNVKRFSIADLLAGTPTHAHVVLLSEQDADSFAPDS
jgi:hypothetical protein